MKTDKVSTNNIIHFISGITISIFVGLHLFNHIFSVFGANAHIEMMHKLRFFYQNIILEKILFFAVFVQIVSGYKLLKSNRKKKVSVLDKIHAWTGIYLAFFFIIHLGAILWGRFYLTLDTNFYFGVAGINLFPFNLFFIPYYTLAILSFFGHIASVYSKKMKLTIFGFSPIRQSIAFAILGLMITLIIFYGLTNKLTGVTLPKEYKEFMGSNL